MADNTVTIDAAWFAELWKTANEADKVCEDCVREKCGECKVVKERDELKAALERANQTNSAQADQLRDALNENEELKAKLAAAERCIEGCETALNNIKNLQAKVDADEMLAIIRAYREKKEAK